MSARFLHPTRHSPFASALRQGARDTQRTSPTRCLHPTAHASTQEGSPVTDERSGTGELKAVAQDAMRLGARALETGRAWLSGRREPMNERDASRRYEERLRQQRHESGMAGRSESGYGSRRWGAGEDWDDSSS